MQESLFPLKLPPGIVNNGTTYQSKGRWFLGNLVRFFQGTVQPIGGWVQRTTSGQTIQGEPNAAFSWLTNDGTAYLAIGTTTNLYVMTAGNVVYDITPGVASPYTGSLRWQMRNFGGYLVAAFNIGAYDTSVPVNAVVWRGDPATAATSFDADDVVPNSVWGVTATPERFCVLFRGADPTAQSFRKPPGVTLDPGTGTDGSGLRFTFVP